MVYTYICVGGYAVWYVHMGRVGMLYGIVECNSTLCVDVHLIWLGRYPVEPLYKGHIGTS